MAHGSAAQLEAQPAGDPIAAAMELARSHRVCESHRDVYAAVLALFHGPRAELQRIETSYTELAFMCELSDSTVRRAVARLVAVGLISVARGQLPGVLVLTAGPHAYRPDPQLALPFLERTEVSDDGDALGPHGVVPSAAVPPAGLVVSAEPSGAARQTARVEASARRETRRDVCAPAPAPARAPTDGLAIAQLAANDEGRSRCKPIRVPEAAAAQDFLPMGSIEVESLTLIPHGKIPASARARDGPHGADKAQNDESAMWRAVTDATKRVEKCRGADNARPLMDDSVINGLAQRTAANYRADKRDLVWMMEQAVADAATHPSRFGLVAEAVLEGRMTRTDLETMLDYVRKKRLAGEITKSSGALFLALAQKRLGSDLKGGGERA